MFIYLAHEYIEHLVRKYGWHSTAIMSLHHYNFAPVHMFRAAVCTHIDSWQCIWVQCIRPASSKQLSLMFAIHHDAFLIILPSIPMAYMQSYFFSRLAKCSIPLSIHLNIEDE